MKASIAGIEAILEKALTSLRAAVDAEGSKLSIALDRFQIQAYELAHVRAELHAANAIAGYAERCAEQGDSVLEERLAGAFVAENVLKIRSRFEKSDTR